MKYSLQKYLRNKSLMNNTRICIVSPEPTNSNTVLFGIVKNTIRRHYAHFKCPVFCDVLLLELKWHSFLHHSTAFR